MGLCTSQNGRLFVAGAAALLVLLLFGSSGPSNSIASLHTVVKSFVQGGTTVTQRQGQAHQEFLRDVRARAFAHAVPGAAPVGAPFSSQRLSVRAESMQQEREDVKGETSDNPFVTFVSQHGASVLSAIGFAALVVAAWTMRENMAFMPDTEAAGILQAQPASTIYGPQTQLAATLAPLPLAASLIFAKPRFGRVQDGAEPTCPFPQLHTMVVPTQPTIQTIEKGTPSKTTRGVASLLDLPPSGIPDIGGLGSLTVPQGGDYRAKTMPLMVSIGLNPKEEVPPEIWNKLTGRTAAWEFTKLIHVEEAAVFATEDSFEVFTVCKAITPGVHELQNLLAHACGIPVEELKPHLRQWSNKQAVRAFLQTGASGKVDATIDFHKQHLAVEGLLPTGELHGPALRHLFSTAVDIRTKVSQDAALAEIEDLIDSESFIFFEWHRNALIKPLIAALQIKAESIRDEELNKVEHKLRWEDSQERGKLVAEYTTKHFMEGPTQYLRNAGPKELAAAVSVVKEVFDLKNEAAALKAHRDANTLMDQMEGNAVLTMAKSIDTSIDGKADIMAIGMSTSSNAPVSMREQLAVPKDQWAEVVADLRNLDQVTEAFILSTCNRFEVYVTIKNPALGEMQVIDYLAKRSGTDVRELSQHLWALHGTEGVRHIFQVACGLDSLVLGEGQILGQCKQVQELADEHQYGKISPTLDHLFRLAVHVGKKARTKTTINQGAVSVSSAGVELAQQKLDPNPETQATAFADKQIAVIGAGTMSRLLLIHLATKECGPVKLLNRTVGPGSNAEILAEEARAQGLEVEVLGMEHFHEQVESSDVVFTLTSHAEPILTKSTFEGMAEKERLIVDVSVPRNVHDDVHDVPKARLFDVDNLREVADANLEKRRAVVTEVEALCEEEVHEFIAWCKSRKYVPVIKQMFQRSQSIEAASVKAIDEELPVPEGAKMAKKEVQAYHHLSKSILGKLMHTPLHFLREGEAEIPLSHIQDLFGL